MVAEAVGFNRCTFSFFDQRRATRKLKCITCNCNKLECFPVKWTQNFWASTKQHIRGPHVVVLYKLSEEGDGSYLYSIAGEAAQMCQKARGEYIPISSRHHLLGSNVFRLQTLLMASNLCCPQCLILKRWSHGCIIFMWSLTSKA